MQTMAVVFFSDRAKIEGEKNFWGCFWLFIPFLLCVFWLLVATGLRGKVRTTHELTGEERV